MTSDYDTARLRAYDLAHNEAFSDLSVQDINRMSFEEWAKLTGRATPSEVAAQASQYDLQDDPHASANAYNTPQATQDAHEAPSAPEAVSGPQGPITDEEFLAWRQERVARQATGFPHRGF